MECLSHVAKRMKANQCKKQDAVLKAARIEKKVHTQVVRKKRDGQERGSKGTSRRIPWVFEKVSLPRTEWKTSRAMSFEIKHLPMPCADK